MKKQPIRLQHRYLKTDRQKTLLKIWEIRSFPVSNTRQFLVANRPPYNLRARAEMGRLLFTWKRLEIVNRQNRHTFAMRDNKAYRAWFKNYPFFFIYESNKRIKSFKLFTTFTTFNQTLGGFQTPTVFKSTLKAHRMEPVSDINIRRNLRFAVETFFVVFAAKKSGKRRGCHASTTTERIKIMSKNY